MAITKQINELNDASPLGSGDFLPVSQSGQTEATKTTVGDLASAVGELNETGALSELTLATSIGKNAIAQALTGKGVQTSPNETLIHMANKINMLPVSITDIRFRQGLILSLNQKGRAQSGYTVCRLANGGYLVYNAAEIGVVPPGNYHDLPDLIAHWHKIDTTSSLEYYIASASTDCNTLIYASQVYGTNISTYSLYNVDWTGSEPVVTLLGNYSMPSTPTITGGQIAYLGITSDRKTVIFSKATGSSSPHASSITMFRADDTSVYASYTTNVDNAFIDHFGQVYIDEVNSILYYIRDNSGNSPIYTPSKIHFESSASAIVIHTPENIEGPEPTIEGSTHPTNSVINHFKVIMHPHLKLLTWYAGAQYGCGRCVNNDALEIIVTDFEGVKKDSITYSCVGYAGNLGTYTTNNPLMYWPVTSSNVVAPKQYTNATGMCSFNPTDNPDEYKFIVPELAKDDIIYDVAQGKFTSKEVSYPGIQVALTSGSSSSAGGENIFGSGRNCNLLLEKADSNHLTMVETALRNSYAGEFALGDKVLTRILISDGVESREISDQFISSYGDRRGLYYQVKHSYVELPEEE